VHVYICTLIHTHVEIMAVFEAVQFLM